MGSAGHKFIAHTKGLSPSAQVKDGGYGLPPHPRVIRSGQRFWSRRAKASHLLVVAGVAGEYAKLARIGQPRAVPLRVTLTTLLATRGDGQGRFYQFQGFSPRMYRTLARVCDADGDHATLCVPEWHPLRPVRLPTRLLPPANQQPGDWVRMLCDLSASSAARLQPMDIESAAQPAAGLLPEVGV